MSAVIGATTYAAAPTEGESPEKTLSNVIASRCFSVAVPRTLNVAGAELPLVRAERVQDARVGHQRREQLIVDDAEVERPLRRRGPIRASA